ncbi:MAG: hypothetical protein COA96_15250 [SAR86 cluster bacterium]|uniref:3-oxoacyl-ACP synthase n=1 Tax=SAR86 cluster bacterium TaxID=2030880 RepID=A0A2A5ARG7_9GAMM|nr:MAG: hypothetical protein COA96_15250 [SAR86 cluster bacterium]
MVSVTISGSGSVLAPHEVETSELIKYAKLDRFGISPNIIFERMGITHVRHADDSVLPGDLATEAAKKAITASGIPANEIDMILYTGIERNCTEPATAHFIANDIGIDPKRLQYCWDMSNACHGFTAGILTARKFLKDQDEGDRIRNVLVCTGERSSGKTKVICEDFRNGRIGADRVQDTLGAFTVGDAGGAMVLSQCESDKGIKAISNSNNPRFAGLCLYQDFGADRGVKPIYAMKMPQICARTKRIIKRISPVILNRLGWGASDIDHGIFHQVGKRVHKDWLDIVGIEEARAPSTYAKWGNLASANLPVIWDMLDTKGAIKPGDNVFVVSAGSGISVTMLGITR